jgi:hypothetical protein
VASKNKNMIKEFYKLTSAEIELVLKAPILVSILVAGADGTIDKKEIKSGIETAKKRQAKAKGGLLEFYDFVAEDFEDKLKVIVQMYPTDSTKRNKIIENELHAFSDVLGKLEKQFAMELYNNLKEISLGIAKSSGGLLGMNSIGDEEIKYVDLPMIKMPGT